MSVTDLLWLLPPFAGVVLGLRLRSPAIPLLVGFVLVVVSLALFGYSMDNYSNYDCQPGEPCPTGEQVIDVVMPVAFLLGASLVLVGFARVVWDYLSGLLAWRRHQA